MKRFTTEQIKQVMKEEGIGNSSIRYVLDKLEKLQNTEVDGSSLTMVKKDTPQWGEGVYVSPSSNINVHFEHNGESLQLHFLTNGKLAVSRQTQKEHYVEINKKQLIDLILSKF